jgi:cephalosporin-C deacetylase-like acetyl esterase
MAGLGDYICPPSGVMAFYNSVTAPKKIVFVQNAQHGNCLESRPQKFTLDGDAVVSAN